MGIKQWNEKTEYSEKHYRWLVKEELGIPLKSGWVVHHIDGNKGNDDINNLALCFSQKAHLDIHKEWRQSFYLQTHEATEMGRFFNWFKRNYVNRKRHKDVSYHHVRNSWMEVLIKLKPISLWYKKDQRNFLVDKMGKAEAKEYMGKIISTQFAQFKEDDGN